MTWLPKSQRFRRSESLSYVISPSYIGINPYITPAAARLAQECVIRETPGAETRCGDSFPLSIRFPLRYAQTRYETGLPGRYASKGSPRQEICLDRETFRADQSARLERRLGRSVRVKGLPVVLGGDELKLSNPTPSPAVSPPDRIFPVTALP